MNRNILRNLSLSFIWLRKQIFKKNSYKNSIFCSVVQKNSFKNSIFFVYIWVELIVLVCEVRVLNYGQRYM